MNDDMRSSLVRNPHLEVDRNNLAMWNTPENRRWGFRNIHWLQRHGLALRASHVLPLHTRTDRHIGDMAEVRRLTGAAAFCAMVVVRRQDILFEAYADDVARDTLHSMQSITKTNLNLIYGRLVAAGQVDLSRAVEHYVPEVGSGYRDVTVQQVLDMNVPLAFDEDYTAPYDPPAGPGERLGYAQEEVAMNWRLAPPGHEPFGVREFAVRLERDDDAVSSNVTRYASPNTDLAGWIAERAGGRDLKAHLVDNMEGAGIEGTFHVALDCDFVPVLSGCGAMTARDMARYGLLFARKGIGVHGSAVGDVAFIEATRGNRGTFLEDAYEGQRYSNQMFTDGSWIGHAGYAGQFLMADPDREAAVAFFSVLETAHGEDDTYLPEVIAMSREILSRL